MTGRILLIEDDDRIRETTRLLLEDEGYEVDEAASGEDGLANLDQRPPICVIVDLMLPGIDGFECCRSIRQPSDVPIIVLTAKTDTHDIVAGLEAGADDYVTKPFHAKELTARIRALLRRSGGGRPSGAITLGDLLIRPDRVGSRRGDTPSG